MLRMENVSKAYHASRPNGHGPRQRDDPNPARRFRLGRRPQRQRQEHAAVDARRDALALRGPRSAGSQSVYDLSPSERARMRREKVGFVFQTFNLVPYLSALENVQIPLFLAKMDEKAQKERATALLERVGLADRLDHKPCELSVGQQQRVALARMLANDPAVILADEPTGNLDPETSQQIIGFLEEFNAEGRTIVMVTHDPRAAKRAKRTLRLQNGAITCQGAGEDGGWQADTAVA